MFSSCLRTLIPIGGSGAGETIAEHAHELARLQLALRNLRECPQFQVYTRRDLL
jgi:hypothetical protein